MKKRISADEFIRIWQIADSIPDVMKKTGLPKATVNARAYNYRKKGVPLKKMTGRRGAAGYNWKDLAELARRLAPKTQGEDN